MPLPNINDLVDMNRHLNDEEYRSRKTMLASYPRAIFVQLDQDCLFCSRPDTYRHFDLNGFDRDFGEILLPVFQRVERINLTGSGELLSLPLAKDILAYIRQMLAEWKQACSRDCFRANPSAVNDFRSHIITRGKSVEEVRRNVEGR